MSKNKKELDIEILMKALEDEKNEALINLTSKKIKEMNFKMLKELELPKETVAIYMKKLNGYRYIDEVKDLKYGAFIKWIPIDDPSYLPLNAGGIICDIKVMINGVIIVYKNFMHRHYQIKMDECLIFQKNSYQELVLLSAMDHLTK